MRAIHELKNGESRDAHTTRAKTGQIPCTIKAIKKTTTNKQTSKTKNQQQQHHINIQLIIQMLWFRHSVSLLK